MKDVPHDGKSAGEIVLRSPWLTQGYFDNPDANGRPQAEVPVTVGTIRELAAWTGGELFYASTPSDTSKVARQVVRELRQQYLIAFEPGTGAGWHPIEIRTTKKNLTVRARGGYVAGGRERSN